MELYGGQSRPSRCRDAFPCLHLDCTSDPSSVLQSGIRKLIRLLEKEPEEQFKPDLYMMLYTYDLAPSCLLMIVVADGNAITALLWHSIRDHCKLPVCAPLCRL